MAARDLFNIVRPKGFYRPDVDGMRALAVLAVIAYHFSPANFPGGFIGVDIFFVISGYLITGILVKAIEESQFPTFRCLLSDFYQRRVRRIFPTLILILAACIGLGWLVLFSSEYARLGKYVAAGAAYVENFVLWGEAGYFNHAAVTKPLLHLWSLAVEEQFYIAWPLVLWVATRQHWPLLRFIGVIAILTFALNAALVLNGQTTHAFYSPIPRTWELMTGAWLSVAHRRGITWLTTWRSGQCWAGSALIVLGLVLIGPTSAFPGFWALLPVFGTALLINAGPATFLNGWLLSWRPVVWVGLISYPLYLWHWVLFSLTIIVFGEGDATFRHASRIVLFLLSVLLAWLSYSYFEAPIRHSRKGMTSIWLAAAVGVLGVAGLSIFLASGVPNRPGSFVSTIAQRYVQSVQMSPLAESGSCFNPQVRMTFLQKRGGEQYLPLNWYCELGDASSETVVLAYGDSHASAMIPALDKYGKTAHVKVVFAAVGSCLAMTDLIVHGDYPHACAALSKKTIQFATATRPNAVVLIESWTGYLGVGKAQVGAADHGDMALRLALHRTLGQYQSLGIPVVLMEDNPLQRAQVPKASIRFATAPTDHELNAGAITTSDYARQQARANSILASVASHYPSASVLKIDGALCNATVCPWALHGQFLYYDSGHLSVAGAMQVYPLLAARLRDLVASRIATHPGT